MRLCNFNKRCLKSLRVQLSKKAQTASQLVMKQALWNFGSPVMMSRSRTGLFHNCLYARENGKPRESDTREGLVCSDPALVMGTVVGKNALAWCSVFWVGFRVGKSVESPECFAIDFSRAGVLPSLSSSLLFPALLYAAHIHWLLLLGPLEAVWGSGAAS